MKEKERIIGYIRVSTKDQNLDRQLIAMREFGISDKHVYQDKFSGKDFERPSYTFFSRSGNAFCLPLTD